MILQVLEFDENDSLHCSNTGSSVRGGIHKHTVFLFSSGVHRANWSLHVAVQNPFTSASFAPSSHM